MSLLPGSKLITEDDFLKSLSVLMNVNDSNAMPIQASHSLEKYCNGLAEMIRNPKLKTEYDKKDGVYSKNIKFQIPYPEMAVTDKLNLSVIYSEAALGSTFTAELTYGINKETFEKALSDSEEKDKYSDISKTSFSPMISFVKDKSDYKPLFYQLQAFGETSESDKKAGRTNDKVLNFLKRFTGVGEVLVTDAKVPHDKESVSNFISHTVQYNAVAAAMIFKALEDSYFINLAIAVSVTGVRKRD